MDDPSERPEGDAREADSGGEPFLEQSAKSLQENLTRSGPVAAASYSLVGGIILLGGIGYRADRRFGTGPWLLIVGLMAGIVVGFYELIKSVRS